MKSEVVGPAEITRTITKGVLITLLGIGGVTAGIQLVHAMESKPARLTRHEAQTELHNMAVKIGKFTLRAGKGYDSVDGSWVTFMSNAGGNTYHVAADIGTTSRSFDPAKTRAIEMWKQPGDSSQKSLDIIITRKVWPDGAVVWQGSEGRGDVGDVPQLLNDATVFLRAAQTATPVKTQS